MDFLQRINARKAEIEAESRQAQLRKSLAAQAELHQTYEADSIEVHTRDLVEPEPERPTLTTNDIKGQPPRGRKLIIKLKAPSNKLQTILTAPRSDTKPKFKISWKRKRSGSENSFLKDLPIPSAPPKKARTPSCSTSDPDVELDAIKKTSQAPTARSTPTKPVWQKQTIIETRKKPEWYADVGANLKKDYSLADYDSVKHVEVLIANCIEAATGDNFAALRDKIHKMEFYPFLSKLLIKKSKILESKGLPQIFDGPYEDVFPWDIKADAEALWRRWIDGDLDGDLMRGVDITKGVLTTGEKKTKKNLTPGYAQKKSANALGENGLVNGQWWPLRLCALRDGAHGGVEAGISGQRGKGAFSVVVSGGYDDRDNGDTIEYCGTTSKDETLTHCTALMVESYTNQTPIRVLRAKSGGHKIHSKYTPEQGIRYDGLYHITGKEILDPATAKYRFTLERNSGQEPIRWQGVSRRPNDQEKKERMIIRKLLE